MYVPANMYKHMHMYMCMSIYVCIYIYIFNICIYIYIITHIYIYICTQLYLCTLIRVRGIPKRSKKSLGVLPGACAGRKSCCSCHGSCSLSLRLTPRGDVAATFFHVFISLRGSRVSIPSLALPDTSCLSPTHWFGSRVVIREL